MMSEQSFVKRHSVAIFFVLVFAISWIGTFAVIGSKFFAGGIPDYNELGIMAATMLNGPFIAGLVMTFVVDGKKGIKSLFGRMKRFRFSVGWYLPILIFPVILFSVAFLLGVFVSPELAPTFGVMGLIGGPMAGLLEETGWMGFAYPKMKGKKSVLTTAIIFGVVHGFWHIVADFLGNFNAFGGYWAPYFFGFCLHVVALRILIVWVYSNTESVGLSILMHMSSTGFFGILISTTMAPQYWVIFYNIYGIALLAIAAVMAIKYGKTLKK